MMSAVSAPDPPPPAPPPGAYPAAWTTESAEMTETAETALRARAAGLGIVDALVFRRVRAGTWAHLGGLGHGRGWAGIVDVEQHADRLLDRVPHAAGEVWRAHLPGAGRVLGPYYATGAAIVRLEPDVVVVLGNPDAPLTARDVDLVVFACDIGTDVVDVLPSKRLADELEVLHTVHDLLGAPVGGGIEQVLHHLVVTAAHALTCELGLLRDGDGRLVVYSADGDTRPPLHWHRVLDEVGRLVAAEPAEPAEPAGPAVRGGDGAVPGGVWTAQDLDGYERLRQLLPEARAVLALPMLEPLGGLLVLAHTDANPRGFSGQCRALAVQVAETGTTIARAALLRAELEATAERASRDARTDPLTGLGNRLAWDEAVAAAQDRADAGACYSVITVDLDGLKHVNDTFGHAAGDELLRRCADVIRSYCDDGDVAVRMGGDEFAILVPKWIASGGGPYARFRQELGRLRPTRVLVAASVGLGTAGPERSLADAFRDADLQMYRHKRARRARWARLCESGRAGPG